MEILKFCFVVVVTIIVNLVIWWLTMDPGHKKALGGK